MIEFHVVFNQNLTPRASDKSIYHLQLEAESSLSFLPGDWLKVAPQNHPVLVKILLEKLHLSGQEVIELRREGQVSVMDALTYHLEITQLNPAILNKLQRNYDLKLWRDRAAMMAYAEGKDILDLLENFPFLVEEGQAFLNLLSPLAPRYYSIASAPDGNRIDLLYREVVYDFANRERRGVTTQFLQQKQKGDRLLAAFSSNPNFKLPETLETPIIMVGAGTGIAPFRGFCQARFQAEASSENWLFFGETYQEHCFLFEQELTAWQRERGLHLWAAFSRDQAHKLYVQDLLWAQKEAVWQVMQRGGVMYVCGSKTRLALGVETVMKAIIASQGQLDEEAAKALWLSWKNQRQVQMDIY